MSPAVAGPATPSVEEAYRIKCIELRRRISEVQADTDARILRKTRLSRQVKKMRMERAILLDAIKQRMPKTEVEGMIDEESEDSSDSPPTVGQNNSLDANNSACIASTSTNPLPNTGATHCASSLFGGVAIARARGSGSVAGAGKVNAIVATAPRKSSTLGRSIASITPIARAASVSSTTPASGDAPPVGTTTTITTTTAAAVDHTDHADVALPPAEVQHKTSSTTSEDHPVAAVNRASSIPLSSNTPFAQPCRASSTPATSHPQLKRTYSMLTHDRAIKPSLTLAFQPQERPLRTKKSHRRPVPSPPPAAAQTTGSATNSQPGTAAPTTQASEAAEAAADLSQQRDASDDGLNAFVAHLRENVLPTDPHTEAEIRSDFGGDVVEYALKKWAEFSEAEKGRWVKSGGKKGRKSAGDVEMSDAD